MKMVNLICLKYKFIRNLKLSKSLRNVHKSYLDFPRSYMLPFYVQMQSPESRSTLYPPIQRNVESDIFTEKSKFAHLSPEKHRTRNYSPVLNFSLSFAFPQ